MLGFIHDQKRWPNGIVRVHHEFIVVQRSTFFGKHLNIWVVIVDCQMNYRTYRVKARRWRRQSREVVCQFVALSHDDFVK